MRKEISTLKISNKSIEVKAEKLESKVREMVQRNSVLEDNIVVEKEKVYNLDKSLEIILEDSQEKEKCLLISGPQNKAKKDLLNKLQEKDHEKESLSKQLEELKNSKSQLQHRISGLKEA